MSATISIQLRVAQDLAEELAALATELTGEVELCRTSTAGLTASVDGETAAAAGQLGAGWAGLVDLLAQGTGAVAGALREAIHSYRLYDAALSDRALYARAGVPVP